MVVEPGQAVGEVVDMAERKATESRRERVGPVVIRNPQGALELDAAPGIRMDVGEPEGQPVALGR